MLALCLCLCLSWAGGGQAFAQTARGAASGGGLIADLSDHLVAITTGFSGARVLLFGAVDGEGDVVVVVRGPNRDETIRRKGRVLGLWAAVASAEIADAPAFYRVAATRAPAEILRPALLDRHQIGLDHLRLAVASADGGASPAAYRDALLRLKRKEGLYGAEPGSVAMIGGRLFRTEMDFPANVPTGTYAVETYLVREGEIVSAQTTPLVIGKSGASAEIFDFANRQAALYGVTAVAVAALAGWIAAWVFRRT